MRSESDPQYWVPIFGPPLESIRNADARQNIWHGPVRSAKTTSSLIAWILFVNEAPPGALFMVGKTETTLERNALLPLRGFMGRNFSYSMGKHKAWMMTTSGQRREIYLYGANDARSEEKIRGSTAAGAYGDELSLWPEGFYRQLLARMSVPGAKLFGTTNPDGPYHWLKRDFIDREGDLSLKAFTWPITANTMLDPEYVKQLKAEYGEGSLWYKRFIDGLWVAAEGAVYDFFNERDYVIDRLPEKAPDAVDIAVDYGTSNATSAGAYVRWNGVPDGQLQAVRVSGYYYDGRATGRQKTDEEYADEITDWINRLGRPISRVIVDPSAASFSATLRQRRLQVVPADNDVLDGIRTQAKMLRKGEYRILADPSNAQCIQDYGAYLWDTRAQARGEDRPLKQNDHTKDEERYFLFSTFGRPAPTPEAKKTLSAW